MMEDDPLTLIAKRKVIADSVEIEAQLQVTHGCRPIVTLLLMARQEAADALASLATCDPNNTAIIEGLQNEVRRFGDLVRWLKKIVVDGAQYDDEITAADHDEIMALLLRTPEGQQEAEQLGLTERTPHDA